MHGFFLSNIMNSKKCNQKKMPRILLRMPNCISDIFSPQLKAYINPIMSSKQEIATLYLFQNLCDGFMVCCNNGSVIILKIFVDY